MLFHARWPIWFVLVLGSGCGARAQVAAAAGLAPGHVTGKIDTVPRVPGLGTFLEGLNAGVTISEGHDSSSGWYSVATPAIIYTISSRFSADVNTSIYLHRNVRNTNPATARKKPLILDRADAADTLFGFHAFFEPGSVQDTITASMTAPTGNRSHGLGTGRVTYDLSNHLERYYKQAGFIVDLGVGDSSGLFNNLVTKDYNSLGALSHYEAGMVFRLPKRCYLESVAYEQLPMGDQKVYRIVERDDAARANEDDPTPTPTPIPIPNVSKVNEDNGFTTFAGVPINNYFSLSGYYNRSLRQHLDTVSFGVTYILRGTPKRRLSMIDRALREAEGGNP